MTQDRATLLAQEIVRQCAEKGVNPLSWSEDVALAAINLTTKLAADWLETKAPRISTYYEDQRCEYVYDLASSFRNLEHLEMSDGE